jgi:hypothetical protein
LIKKYLKQNAIKMGLLVLFVFQGGCAANKMDCPWRNDNIIANGHENEWKGAPQYYDKDQQLAIWVTSDAEALYLCVSTSDKMLKRKLHRTGLSVWVDPKGGKEQIFGIHLPSGNAKRIGQGQEPGEGALPPPDEPGRHERNEQEPSFSEPLKELEITYWGATGPLKMDIDEVRETGIDVGMGKHKDGSLVYEFNIGFKAAPSLSDLKPGMIVGIGIQAGSSKQDGHKGSLLDEIGKDDLGGGTSRRSRGPGPGGNGNAFKVWLHVKLAERTTG